MFGDSIEGSLNRKWVTACVNKYGGAHKKVNYLEIHKLTYLFTFHNIMAYLMSQILLCVILGIETKRLACKPSNVTPPSYTEYNRSIAQGIGVKHDTHSLSVLVKVLFKPRKQTFSHTHAYLSTVLLMFDIKINPGPHIPKYPCGACGRAVSNKQAAVSCDVCDQWFHI